MNVNAMRRRLSQLRGPVRVHNSVHPNFSSGEIGDYEAHFTDKDVGEQFDDWLRRESEKEGKCGGLKFKYKADK